MTTATCFCIGTYLSSQNWVHTLCSTHRATGDARVVGSAISLAIHWPFFSSVADDDMMMMMMMTMKKMMMMITDLMFWSRGVMHVGIAVYWCGGSE